MFPILIEEAKKDVLRRDQTCPTAQILVVASLMPVYLRDSAPFGLLTRAYAPIPFSLESNRPL
jgi:hypothetical protein